MGAYSHVGDSIVEGALNQRCRSELARELFKRRNEELASKLAPTRDTDPQNKTPAKPNCCQGLTGVSVRRSGRLTAQLIGKSVMYRGVYINLSP